jgi:hypothetical protein
MTSGRTTAIRVSHLYKKYTPGGPQERFRTFRDAIVSSVKAPLAWLSTREPPQQVELYYRHGNHY